jgi:hypothetical protein
MTLASAIHPFNNGKIIVNYPGAEGSLDGYKGKYKTLAEYIVSQGLASVVRLPNPHTYGFGWNVNLRHALTYVLENSKSICGSDHPDIYLMGLSAGAGAIATLAWEYPEVKKILLLEPALMTGDFSVMKGIAKYRGELYVVVGSGDEAIGTLVGDIVMDNAAKASRKEMFVIPNCDHQFRGEINGRILSQAPFYAFSDDPKPSFPDEKAGIKLYD